ncbi:hypothetical protein H1R20_g5685, partial [Candolleomyces eurysporus]
MPLNIATRVAVGIHHHLVIDRALGRHHRAEGPLCPPTGDHERRYRDVGPTHLREGTPALPDVRRISADTALARLVQEGGGPGRHPQGVARAAQALDVQQSLVPPIPPENTSPSDGKEENAEASSVSADTSQAHKAEAVDETRVKQEEQMEVEEGHVADIKVEPSPMEILPDAQPPPAIPDLKKSRSPSPQPPTPTAVPIKVHEEDTKPAFAPIQSSRPPVEDERPQNLPKPAAPPFAHKTDSSLKPQVLKPTHGYSSPAHLAHPTKESSYSPRPPFKMEEKLGQDYSKLTASPVIPAAAPEISSSASHSPKPPFAPPQQPERAHSGDYMSKPPGWMAPQHRTEPLSKRDTIYSDKDILGLTAAWQQRMLLEREDWTLSHQAFQHAYELELAMVDLQAAQARRKTAEIMLDKAKNGNLGIDSPLEFGEADDVMT